MLTKIDVKGFLRIINAFNAVLTKAASTELRGEKKTFNFCNLFKPFIYILLII